MTADTHCDALRNSGPYHVADTIPEIPPMINWRLPSKNAEPSQPGPAIEIRATVPAFMMLPFTVAAADALNTSMLIPAAASIRIMMAGPMSKVSMLSWPPEMAV